MRNPKLNKLRESAFKQQRGRCCYCGFLMWQGSVETFAKDHQISLAQAQHFQCTAEHLQARRDGGKDTRSNIAAACKRCNQLRHQRKKAPSPDAYQQLVQKRLRKGKWNTLPLGAKLDRQKPHTLKIEGEQATGRA
ncbi:HNH endonuclease [Halopseudomonas maritima]|nr:HNH endonuclease [Halopseudomonas maritima]